MTNSENQKKSRVETARKIETVSYKNSRTTIQKSLHVILRSDKRMARA